jgi:hypothetical protein
LGIHIETPFRGNHDRRDAMNMRPDFGASFLPWLPHWCIEGKRRSMQ